MLQMLRVSAPCGGVLMMNGMLVGEVPCVVPAPLNSDALLTFLPLDAGYLPCAARLELSHSEDARIRGAHVTRWPDGLYDVKLRVQALPQPAEIIDSRAFVGGEAALFRDGEGLSLRIFWEDGGVLTLREPGVFMGEIVIAEGKAPTVILRGHTYERAYLRAAIAGAELLAVSGEHIDLDPDGRVIRVRRVLPGVAGHIEEGTYELIDGRYRVAERVLSPGSYAHLTPAQNIRALTDAVLYGLDDEAAACLSPALRESLTPFRLKACMLPFERYEDAHLLRPARDEERLALIHEISDGFAEAKVFCYDVGDDGLVAGIRGYAGDG